MANNESDDGQWATRCYAGRNLHQRVCAWRLWPHGAKPVYTPGLRVRHFAIRCARRADGIHLTEPVLKNSAAIVQHMSAK
eukprot:1424863-Pyramimonas_sp.AAC.1